AAEMEPALKASIGGELEGSAMKQRAFDAMVRRMENALANSPYLMGEAFTGADLLVASAIPFGRHALPESPVLDAYTARCQARPAAQRGQALDEASGVQSAS